LLFSSNVFIFVFLPIALIGYQLLSRFGRPALLFWLTASSLFFYGYWNPIYLLLLCGSMLMNFLISTRLEEGRSESSRSQWLIGGIVVNLSLLVYYKYLFPILNFLHAHGAMPREFANVILPLGISFFTFTQIAYLIDVRQNIAKRQGLLPYSVFVTVFPHLIAGPIIHPRELMPQLEEGRIGRLRSDNLALGVTWFMLGLGKKVLIADRVAPLADAVFGHVHAAGFTTTWVGILSYAVQLYFDFSGYSDMALGLAKMFGLDFPVNFNSPFKSQSVIEFWTRWHMTLSRYLNEYLYTPIVREVNGWRMDAGKKVSKKAQTTPEGFASMVAFPLMTTMFLAGVWHGAGLQYLVFGLLHGFYLTVNHAWRLWTPRGHRLHQVVPAPVMILLTFVCVLVGMVFFRAANVGDGCYVVGTMFGLHGAGTAYAGFPYLDELPAISKFMGNLKLATPAIGFALLIVWGAPNTQEILGQTDKDHVWLPTLLPRLKWRPNAVWSLGITAMFVAVILMLDAMTRFLYFQF
jgi:D-alanyl-lipoteichoic acid acyltransferase DltB (MBOAT superfamily)